jgi:transcriptional antiterminator
LRSIKKHIKTYNITLERKAKQTMSFQTIIFMLKNMILKNKIRRRLSTTFWRFWNSLDIKTFWLDLFVIYSACETTLNFLILFQQLETMKPNKSTMILKRLFLVCKIMVCTFAEIQYPVFNINFWHFSLWWIKWSFV